MTCVINVFTREKKLMLKFTGKLSAFMPENYRIHRVIEHKDIIQF